MHYVIVPGIGNSDADHWQTLWERRLGQRATRISVASWEHPDLRDWITGIGVAADAVNEDPVVVVAHSLRCLAAAHALGERPTPWNIAGAFLAAPPDPTSSVFPSPAGTFAHAAPAPLGVPTLVVA